MEVDDVTLVRFTHDELREMLEEGSVVWRSKDGKQVVYRKMTPPLTTDADDE